MTAPSPLPVAVIVAFQDKTVPILIKGAVKVVAARLFAWGALALLQDNVTTLTMSEYRSMKNAGVKFHGEPKVEPYGTGVIYINQEPTKRSGAQS